MEGIVLKSHVEPAEVEESRLYTITMSAFRGGSSRLAAFSDISPQENVFQTGIRIDELA